MGTPILDDMNSFVASFLQEISFLDRTISLSSSNPFVKASTFFSNERRALKHRFSEPEGKLVPLVSGSS